MRGPWWSPDGHLLLVSAIGPAGRGLYTVDATNGATQLLLTSKEGHLVNATWSSDGESIYFWKSKGLIRWERATGHEQILYQGPRLRDHVALSPNGQWLAFYAASDLISRISIAGGTAQAVLRLEKPLSDNDASFLAWTPDGQYLLFPGPENRIWQVHVTLGQSQPISPSIRHVTGLAVHPDGKHLALSVEEPGYALWALRGFAPD